MFRPTLCINMTESMTYLSNLSDNNLTNLFNYTIISIIISRVLIFGFHDCINSARSLSEFVYVSLTMFWHFSFIYENNILCFFYSIFIIHVDIR